MLPEPEPNSSNVFTGGVEPDNMFSETVEEPEIVNLPLDSLPIFGSKEWHELVMANFEKDELFNGNPTCDGLRRVLELMVGPISKKELSFIKPPDNPKGIATIAVSVTCQVGNPNHPLYGTAVVEQDIADCGPHNTDDPKYSKYQSAMAETRAEARCYRKLLRLRKVVASEETSDGNFIDFNPNDKIDDKQLDIVDLIAKRGNVSIPDVIVKLGYKNVKELTKDQATNLIKMLGDLSAGREEKGDLGEYRSDWRDK